jgi:hypothetical protein
LRRVVVWDAVNQWEIVLLTNLLPFGPARIPAIYKGRWEILLFFKGLKQNLNGEPNTALYAKYAIPPLEIQRLKTTKWAEDTSASLRALKITMRMPKASRRKRRVERIRLLRKYSWLLEDGEFTRAPMEIITYRTR